MVATKGFGELPQVSQSGGVKLLEPLNLGVLQAPNRIIFGPHETNLGWGDLSRMLMLLTTGVVLWAERESS